MKSILIFNIHDGPVRYETKSNLINNCCTKSCKYECMMTLNPEQFGIECPKTFFIPLKSVNQSINHFY